MSLKDELNARELPSAEYAIQRKDPSEAQAELEKAARALRQAEIRGDKTPEHKADLKRCKAAVTRAKKKVESCFTVITIRAIETDQYEDLISDHPPTDEQLAEAGKDPADRPEWNEDTFYPALLAACVDGDMTAGDWADFLEHKLSRGERRQLMYALIAVNENERMPESMMLPKGSLGTGAYSSR